MTTCLQELSRNWYAKLVPFFDSREYTLVFASFHNEPSGYMGVAMAWPRQLHAVDVCLKQISRVVDWTVVCKACGCELTEPTPSNSCHPCYDRYAPPSYAFEQSRSRQNVAIFVRFEKNFCVGTYHMPCEYQNDEAMQLMNIHLALFAKFGQEWSAGCPLVLAGDFNFYPDDSPYQAITTGALPDGHPQKPMGRLGAIPFQPMRSAYVACTGKEPDATSFGRVPETMDYIFLSGEWAVDFVRPTRPVPSPYMPWSIPDATEPSDHFCVGAMLRLSTNY